MRSDKKYLCQIAMNISAPKSNEPLPSPDFYVNESVACNPKKNIKINLVKYTLGMLN